MTMVSVVIPYYNRGHTLPRALDSVCRQTYRDFEIILVNDGSTDQSDKVVEKYIEKHPDIYFKHLYQENTGPSGARNNGIRNAKGRYIAFLDSDDSWEPGKLQMQVEYMELNRDITITGTNYYIVKDNKWNRYSLEPFILKAEFYRMLFKTVFLTSTVVIRREVFDQDNIWFMVGKHQGEDVLLFLQIIRKHSGVRFSIPMANYFKLEYGEKGGLTSDLNKLLENDLDNLKILYSENSVSQKKISILLFYLLYIYLYLKHLKRVLRSGWYKKINKQKSTNTI